MLRDNNVPDIAHEISHNTLDEITSPTEAISFQEPFKQIAASGAGGLGLGASIDVEQMPLVTITLAEGEPNELPIEPVGP